MNDQLRQMLDVIRQLETADAVTLLAKLFEEGGELAEATLIDAGFCQHKADLTEKAMGECADVLICTLGIMAKLNQHQNLTTTQLIDLFRVQLNKKFAKYENIMKGQ